MFVLPRDIPRPEMLAVTQNSPRRNLRAKGNGYIQPKLRTNTTTGLRKLRRTLLASTKLPLRRRPFSCHYLYEEHDLPPKSWAGGGRSKLPSAAVGLWYYEPVALSAGYSGNSLRRISASSARTVQPQEREYFSRWGRRTLLRNQENVSIHTAIQPTVKFGHQPRNSPHRKQ